METKKCKLNTYRFSENLAHLFFLLSRHKFSSIALVTVVNFNAEKRKKKAIKIRKAMGIEYMWCLTEFNTKSKQKYCSCACEKKNEKSNTSDYSKKGIAAVLGDLCFSLFV